MQIWEGDGERGGLYKCQCDSREEISSYGPLAVMRARGDWAVKPMREKIAVKEISLYDVLLVLLVVFG
jgi:hypothetical protein